MIRSDTIFLILLSLINYPSVFSQSNKVTGILNALPLSNENARAKGLIELAEFYSASNPDSCLYYADVLFTEARLQHDYDMMGRSLLIKAEVLPENFSSREKLLHKAIEIFKITSNFDGLASAHNRLGLALFGLCEYEESISHYDLSYEFSRLRGNRDRMINARSTSGMVYEAAGDYVKAFQRAQESLEMCKQENVYLRFKFQLTNIANLFLEIGDLETSLDYFRQAFSGFSVQDFKKFDVIAVLRYAGLFNRLNVSDSADYYYSLIDTSQNRSLRFYLFYKGEDLLLQSKYEDALPILQRSLQLHRDANDRHVIMRILNYLAKINYESKKYNEARLLAWNGLNRSQETKSRKNLRDSYFILYSIYNTIGLKDSSYYYFIKYSLVGDSIATSQIKGKLFAYGFEQKIELLNKEKIAQAATLKNEKLLKKMFIAGSIILLVVASVIFRIIILKRKNERMKLVHDLELQKLQSLQSSAELQVKTADLEMKALRAQMNPHFIFNSLNSINRYVLQNNKSLASEYLTKFSRLVRLILQNSQESFITLESELESLELYLELEEVRFGQKFNYKIKIDEDLDVSAIKVPPLIIQPFAENSIWHGLMHKEGTGKLTINISQISDSLSITIRDDGIGREKAREIKSKSASIQKSLGMKITSERLAMLQKSTLKKSVVTVNDIVLCDGTPDGTEVKLEIPIFYD